jgi:hypothetical protein
MMREGGTYDPYIREAILRIRGKQFIFARVASANDFKTSARGKHRVIALTNNFGHSFDDLPKSELEFLGRDSPGAPDHLVSLFDDYCDSAILGMRYLDSCLLETRLMQVSVYRKPDPEFYLLACSRNGIKPEEAVFLDDIRMLLLNFLSQGLAAYSCLPLP